MAMRLFILGTETRHHYIGPEIPDDPHDVSKNFIVIPDMHRFVSCLRKPEIKRSCEKLPGVIDASRVEQFLCSNNAEPLAQFGTDYVLAAVPSRNGKISGVIERTVRPERHEISVFVVGVRRDVKNAAEHIELLECELNLAGTHLFWRQQWRRISGIGRARHGEGRDHHDGCAPTALFVAAISDRRLRAAMV